jgi:hypothetical protein
VAFLVVADRIARKQEGEMMVGLEALYQEIADAMKEAIPEEWSTARIEAIFYPECIQYDGEYTRKADGALRSFCTNERGERAFEELRNKFQEAGEPLWGQARFELRADGKFTMKWGYDNCDENGDTRFDVDELLKRAEDRHKRLTRGEREGRSRGRRKGHEP